MAWSITETLGRPPRLVEVEIVRELDESDLAGLIQDRGIKPPILKRLTDMHHGIARLVAQGEAGYAIAMATGYSESRISILKSDPAFQELVAHYREETEGVRSAFAIDRARKMEALHSDVVESMHEDVLNDILTPIEKVHYARFAADRTGFGPATKNQNTNLNIDLADTLAEGRRRADELSAAVPAARADRGLLASPSVGRAGGPEGAPLHPQPLLGGAEGPPLHPATSSGVPPLVIDAAADRVQKPAPRPPNLPKTPEEGYE